MKKPTFAQFVGNFRNALASRAFPYETLIGTGEIPGDWERGVIVQALEVPPEANDRVLRELIRLGLEIEETIGFVDTLVFVHGPGLDRDVAAAQISSKPVVYRPREARSRAPVR